MDSILENRTDELPVGTQINSGGYEIAQVNRPSKNSFNYIAVTPDGNKVAVKEFYLRDMCVRDGTQVRIRAKKDASVFSSLVKAFTRDAAFLTSLDSEFVANVSDLIEENGTAYMVSAIPLGTLLSDVLDTSQKMSNDTVMKVANDLARALVEIHGFGMLHRDINPSNIVIAKDGPTVLLPDFGTFREDRSKASKVVSSVLQSAQNYAPFELTFDDARQGDGSDIYCLGAVLYHLITGAPPVPSLDRIAAVAEDKDDPYVPLEGSVTGYSEQFLRAIDMTLELFFDNRVHSATELMFIISKEPDLAEAQTMKRDVNKRSAPLHKKGLFSRVRNLFSRL